MQNLTVKLMEALFKLLALIPLRVSRAGGRLVGRLLMAVDKKHRRIVRDGLRLSFPEKDEAWVEATGKKCFEHLGMIISELPYLAAAPAEKLMSITRVHNLQRLKPYFDAGQSVLVLTGHIGNWEWSNVALGYLGCRGNVVARPLDNKALDTVVNNWRQRTGQKVVAKDVSLRKLLPIIKSGQVLATLLDQNMDWYDGPWVDFFGRPACTSQGLALLAMLLKVPVLPMYCTRADDGYFDLHIDEAVPLYLSGDRKKDVWQNTQNYTKALENIIRQKPEQWLWLHQRWKTKNYCPWPREDS